MSKQSNLFSFPFIFGSWLHNSSRKQCVCVCMCTCVGWCSDSMSLVASWLPPPLPARAGQTANRSAGESAEVHLVRLWLYAFKLRRCRHGCISGTMERRHRAVCHNFGTSVWFVPKRSVGGRVTLAVVLLSYEQLWSSSIELQPPKYLIRILSTAFVLEATV